VLPRIGAAAPGPDVLAVVRKLILAAVLADVIGKQHPQRLLVGRPQVDRAGQMPAEEGEFTAWDARVEVAVRAADAGERFDRPTARDPPPTGVVREQRRGLGGGADQP